jgi:hypothetical protein
MPVASRRVSTVPIIRDVGKGSALALPFLICW